MNNTLKIFVKNPEIGKVKTRLAATVGDKEALKVYYSLLSYTKELVLKVEAEKEVWYSEFIDTSDLWNNEGFTKKKQEGEDLGARMKKAFQDSFLKDEQAHVILIGSDCAELEEDHLKNAFEHLRDTDVVIGPAKDGGYYLVGMSKFLPELFEGVRWSTSEVLQQTMEKIKRLSVSYYLLEALNDVDNSQDWERVRTRITSND
ncbi:MAG: TIGR04282 family arsenosugar biosynthesis glycosyltransferase [Balneolaceae bacterium]